MGCVNTVTPFLNQATEIQHWEVDLQDPNRVLTVDLEDGSQPGVVKEALKEAGYAAEELV